MDRLQFVAVEHADVVGAGLDHQEQVERVGIEARLRIVVLTGKGLGAVDDPAGEDIFRAPFGFDGGWGEHVLGQRADLLIGEQGAEGRHLGGWAAVADHLFGAGLSQAAQVLG